MGDAVGDGRVDGVLGDVALDAEVVVAAVSVGVERAELHLHLVGGLPGADDRPRRCGPWPGSRSSSCEMAPQVVEDVLGGDGLGADAAFGEGDVLGNARIEVVADHQHVEMLVDGVDREGAGGVGDEGSTLAAPRRG